MTPKELARRSADEILKTLGRDEETLKAKLQNKQRGGYRWTEEEIEKELVLVGVVRELKGPEQHRSGLKSMSPEQLQKMITKRMDELFALRMELSRKTGDMPKARDDINFEKYVTK